MPQKHRAYWGKFKPRLRVSQAHWVSVHDAGVLSVQVRPHSRQRRNILRRHAHRNAKQRFRVGFPDANVRRHDAISAGNAGANQAVAIPHSALFHYLTQAGVNQHCVRALAGHRVAVFIGTSSHNQALAAHDKLQVWQAAIWLKLTQQFTMGRHGQRH